MNVNYNFLIKLFSELTNEQKIKFNKAAEATGYPVSKAV
jgi:hypothetical protein